MVGLEDLIADLNLDEARAQELVARLQAEPANAMAIVEEFGLSTELLQKMMFTIMSQPELLQQMMQQAGLSDANLANFAAAMGGNASDEDDTSE